MEKYLRKLLFLLLGLATLVYGAWISSGWIGKSFSHIHQEVALHSAGFEKSGVYLRWCLAQDSCTAALVQRLVREAPVFELRQGVALIGVGLGMLLFALLSRTTSQTIERKRLERESVRV